MKKWKYKKLSFKASIVLAMILFLSVGYAAISSIDLSILGSIFSVGQEPELDVAFTDRIDTYGNGTITASKVSDRVAEFDIAGLKAYGDTAKIVYQIENKSTQYYANLRIRTTDNDSEEYFDIQSELGKKDALAPGETTILTITVKVIKVLTGNDDLTANVKVMVNGTASKSIEEDWENLYGYNIVYTTLYTDGTLVFSRTGDTIEGKQVSKQYGDISGRTFTSSETLPWNEDKTAVNTIVIDGKIKPENTSYWFADLPNLTEIENISNLDTSDVTDMSHMIEGPNQVEELDLSSFKVNEDVNVEDMFNNTNNLQRIYYTEEWDGYRTPEKNWILNDYVVTLNPNSYVYDGTEHKPEVSIQKRNGTPIPITAYRVAYKNNVNAGTATVEITNNEQTSYNLPPLEKNFIIQKQPIEITASIDTSVYMYDGTEHKPNVEVLYNGTPFPTSQYEIEYNNYINAGTAFVTIREREKSNYTFTPKNINYIIQKKVIIPSVSLNTTEYTYSGEENRPDATVRDGDTIIPSNQYTINYQNNVNAGSATATISSLTNGNYSFEPVNINFTINKKTVEVDIVLQSNEPIYYDMTEKTPAVYVYFKGTNTTVPASEYQLTYSNNTGPGTAYIHVDNKTGGNYIITSATKTFEITRITYTITYNLNGGQKSSSDATTTPWTQEITHYIPYNITSEIPYRNGYTFGGWSESADSTTVKFTAGQQNVTEYENKTIFAIWTIVSKTCSSGKYLPKNSTSCSNCPAGSYCTGGNYSFNPTEDQGIIACAIGSYSEASSSSCTVCPAGTTTSATGKPSCDLDCSNKNKVANWETPNWNNNTPTNICVIKTCSTGYTLSENSCLANSYTINYTMRGGVGGAKQPTSATYDEDVQISNPTKTIIITGNANETGITSGAPTSTSQTFSGWTSTTMGSNAKTGTSANPTTSWTGTSTKNTYFKNLKESGTVTMIANWTPVAATLPTISNKAGYTCKWYSEPGTSGGSLMGTSGATWTPTETTPSEVTVYARCTINNPNTPTITGGETRIYGASTTTLTCSTNTTYASGANIYYSFGYASSDGGIPSDNTWSTPSTNNTYTISDTAYVGQRWYSCRIYASDGINTTETFTSASNADTEVTINNAKLTFDENGCGTLSGTNPAYVKKNATGVYTGIRNTTAGTMPSVGKTGYTFNGWYEGSTKVINGDGSPIASVSNWTDTNSKWLVTADKTLTANCSANQYTISFNPNGGSGGQTSDVQATYGQAMPAITTTPPTRAGYTFAGWYDTDASSGGTQYYTAAGASARTWNKTTNATLYARWTANTYVITYYQGNGTSTQGSSAFQLTTTCTYNANCTLATYASLGGTFPLNDKGWNFTGWSVSETSPLISYTNGQSFTYNISDNINLYAVGKRDVKFAIGIAPTTIYDTRTQYWIPYSTDVTYATAVPIPSSTEVGSIGYNWNFQCFRANNTASSTCGIAASHNGTDYKIPVGNVIEYRTIYKRTLTLSFNANGGTGTIENLTGTQYYNSGYPSSGSNSGANVSTVTFTLPSSSAYSYTGYTFSKWAAGSTSGTQYSEGASYTEFKPAVNNSTTTQTMYAIWTANELVFDDQILDSGMYGLIYVSNAFIGASNGTGSYTYTFDSGAPGGATIDSATRKIVFPGTTNARTYEVIVKATDNNSNKSKTAKMTITIAKSNATCPTLTSYSGLHDRSSHTITVSGGSGGTIQYRTSTSDDWVTTKPTRTNAGTTTVYVQVAGDNNHNTVQCYTSGTTNATINLYNARVDFNLNGGSISGTTPLYIPKNATNVYTGRSNTTAGTIPTASKEGYTFDGWYTAQSGGTKVIAADKTVQASVSEWTDADKKWLRTSTSNTENTNPLYAHYTLITPEIPTISGGTTKIYGASVTTLTCTTTSTYPSGISIYYSFGYATSDGGTPGSTTWTTPSTTNTLSIAAAAYVGIRYYSCRAYANDGTSSSATINSAVSADTAMTINNAKLTFNATTNGGTLSGSSELYVKKGETAVYTGIRNTTAGTIPTATKTGWTFAGWYDGTTMVIDGSGVVQASVTNWTDANKKWQITANKTLTAKYTINNPATPTISGGATKIYGASATTLTCTTTSTYASGTSIYYSFGYATSDGGTPGSNTWTTASTTNTLSISATAYVGIRYYSCRAYASDGTSTSSTITSAASADTAMTINNAKITFNATTNGGTLSGSSELYVKKGETAVYTGIRNTTAGTIPSATKTGWTFAGWYDGDTMVINGSGVVQASVSGWTDSSKKWQITTNKTLTAKYTINDPAVPTITGGASKVYNYQATTLTCSTSTTYASGTSLYYSFGYATSSGGTPDSSTWTTPSTTKTLSVAKAAYRGSRWYSCRVYASDGTSTSATKTSSSATQMDLLNARIDFITTLSGGTLSGSDAIYVGYGATNIYTTNNGTTAATIPTATKTGYTFAGWYNYDDVMVINGSKAVQASVANWTDSGKKWILTTLQRTNNQPQLNVLFSEFTPNTYTIGYTMNNGPNPSTKPTSGTYDADVQISNPGNKSVTVTGNANSSGATVGSATTGTQTFSGWTSTTMGSNAKTGTAANPTTAWTGTSTKNTFFKNLRESGTVTMIANWSGSMTLPTATKTGFTCKWYTASGTSGGSLMAASGGSWTIPSNSATAVTAYARCTINNPATPKITGGATKVYGASATTLTCSTTTTYVSGTSIYYSFGYATSDGGTPGSSTWTTPSTTNTLSISATEYVGQRWYSCRAYATDGTNTSSTVTSAASADTAMTINNATLTFDATTNGGEISGTTPLYVKKGVTGVYTGIRNTTAGTIPTATKAGWTFTGWYSGNTKIIAADGTIQASVSGWTDANKKWQITANKTLTAKYTINNPATPTISGGTGRVYNYAATTLTCNATAYASDTSVYYSFGYATSDGGTPGDDTWTTPSTTKTLAVAKNAFLGSRWYSCRVYATDGTSTTATVASAVTADTAVTFVNARVFFDVATNGGTISGSVRLYVPYGATNVYTGRTNKTAGTIPSATKTGYTFNGWFTAASGGTKVIAADGTVQASVDGWTNANKYWLRTSTSNNDTTNVLYAQFSANQYTIGYTTNNGPNPSTKPTKGTYDADVQISNPGSKSVTITGNENSTGATVGSATTGTQTFTGWTSTTMGSNAKTGTAANPTTAWTGTSTKNTYFRNLKEEGTVTMVANWSGSMALPTVSKTGYTCKWYTASGTSGGSLMGTSGATYTLPNNSKTAITTYARCTINNPATPTISGAATKVYNSAAVTLTCNATAYASGTSVYYSFGYATSDGGTPDDATWTTASTTKTLSVAKNAYRGSRWYSCRVYATDGTSTTTTVASAVTADAAVSFVNARVFFDVATNGGTISGAVRLYVPYGATNVYTGRTNTTAGTIPTATKTGYTFNGWFTAASGGTKVIAADGTVQASVEGWTDASKRWLRTAATNNDTVNVLYAQFSVNQYTISYTMNNGPNPSTKPTKGTYDADVQISNPGSKSITITPNANSSGATVGAATTGTQTFSGWTSTTVGSNAKTGTAANPTTAWTGTSTKNTYFRNLRESGTVTMIANYSGTMKLPTATKPGNNCSFYTTSGNSGGTLMGASGANYTIPSNSATAVTAYARCSPMTIQCSAGQYLAKSSTTCSGCTAGSYCPGGSYTYNTSSNQGITACVQGSYSAASKSVCTACTGKTTSAAGQTSCNSNCTNATGVATWKTASWSANTVTNLCTINTCSTGYSLSSNKCNPVTHVLTDGTIGKATLNSGSYKAVLQIQGVAGSGGYATLKIPGNFAAGDTVTVTAVQNRSNNLYYLAFALKGATAVSATGYPYTVEPYMNTSAGWFAIFYDYNGTSKTFTWTLNSAKSWLEINFNRSNSDATFTGSMSITSVKVNGTAVL